LRDKISADTNLSQNQAEDLVKASEKIRNIIGTSEIKKIIFVPNKLINIVI
jgi:leucyl-tRNA synthetase